MFRVPFRRQTVAELGTIIANHCGLEQPKFVYTPSGQDHAKAVLADVGKFSRRVTLDNPVQSVVAFGLRTDDIITVTSTKVVVPIPSREHLLSVKTSAWKSETPRLTGHGEPDPDGRELTMPKQVGVIGRSHLSESESDVAVYSCALLHSS